MENEIDQIKIDDERINYSIDIKKNNIKNNQSVIETITNIMKTIDNLYSIGGNSKNVENNKRLDAMRRDKLDSYDLFRKRIYERIDEEEKEIKKLRVQQEDLQNQKKELIYKQEDSENQRKEYEKEKNNKSIL